MRLILIRHGETDHNRQQLVQGQSDGDLNKLGRAQARAVAEALKGEGVDAIYTSPLRRALEVARAINGPHGVELCTLDGLKELNAGEFDGLTLEDMIARYQGLMAESGQDAAEVRLPGGESISDLQERAWAAVEGILKEEHSSVVVVAHNLALICIIARALGLDISRSLRLSLDLASISILEFDDRLPRLVLFNDTCHLEDVTG